jgi:hypothetical protein
VGVTCDDPVLAFCDTPVIILTHACASWYGYLAFRHSSDEHIANLCRSGLTSAHALWPKKSTKEPYMYKTAVAVVATLLLPVGAAYASCKTEACRRAVAWKSGFTAVVLNDSVSRGDYFAVLNAIRTSHGSVAIEAERVFLGWLPRSEAGKLQAMPAVRTVLHSAIPDPGGLVHNVQALGALSFFNRVLTGEYEDTVEEGLAVRAEPLTNCVLYPRSSGVQIAPVSDGAVPQDVSPSERQKVTRQAADTARLSGVRHPSLTITPNYWYHTTFVNAEMRGRVTVQVFRVDSDGTGDDTNEFTWTNTDFFTARDQVYGAFTFWVNEANARGITPALSFRVNIMDPFSRYTRTFVPTPTKYEPVRHSTGDDYRWMNDALGRVGYGSSTVTVDNVYLQNDAFNTAQMNDPTYGPFDHSFTAYIAYNPYPAAPDHFTNGYGAYVPWADGPQTTLLWNSLGWGGQNLGRVLTHETGHIFWACDEYYNAGNNTGCFSCKHCWYNVGPRNQVTTPWITNANCPHTIDGTEYLCAQHVSCMMNDNAFVLCPYTPAHIGW